MEKKDSIKSQILTQFANLDNEHLVSEIIQVSMIKHYKEGQLIIEYGDNITHIPLVINGSVKVSRQSEDESEIFLYYLNGGDTCAASFSCCMVKKRSEISAVAEDNSTLLMVPLERASAWMSKYPEWRNFIFNMYDDRIFSLIDTIDRLAFSKLDEQLLEYLELKSDAVHSRLIETTHGGIATDLNVTREAISRLLKKLEKSGQVKLGRNKIELLN